MTPLDIITLDQAKTHLVVLNDDFYDTQITGIIKTAISMVEQYTGYYMYQRAKSYPITSEQTSITDFPLQITGITDTSGNPVSSFNIGITIGSLDTYVSYWGWYDGCYGQNGTAMVNALVGYTAADDIPNPLIGAAYKIITYLFENKDAYASTLPYDIQLMLNQYRRSASI